MVILPTRYTNLFVAMNPAICRPRWRADGGTVSAGCSVRRKPPTIIREAERVQARLMDVFGFRPAIFAPHVANFPKQVIFQQSNWGASRRVVIDVRYRWSNEYYHFLTEALPNALLIKREHACEAVACAEAAFTGDLFYWFAIDVPVIQRTLGRNRVRCRYVEGGNPSPEKIAVVREVVARKLSFERTLGILIRRQQSRRILNEGAVLALLRQRYPTLEWKVFDKLSVDDTARFFSKAAVIAGPHGAGFANMLFSGSGTTIVEFMPLEQPNLCYWHLAEMLGNPYVMIPCPSDRSRSMVVDLGSDILASLPGP
jgi:hypothetical protein